jgi:hypothetical protein
MHRWAQGRWAQLTGLRALKNPIPPRHFLQVMNSPCLTFTTCSDTTGFYYGTTLWLTPFWLKRPKMEKFFWVKFAPQFHAHLVKCTVALIPCPLYKVKKVMFRYILELLNGEGPQAFFDLTMGLWWATQAQKEKRQLV